MIVIRRRFLYLLITTKTEDAIAYEDRFVSESHLIALSKHPRKITSSDAVHIYKQSEEDKNNRIFLFVRKIRMIMKQKSSIFWGKSLQRELRDRFTWKKQRTMPLR